MSGTKSTTDLLRAAQQVFALNDQYNAENLRRQALPLADQLDLLFPPESVTRKIIERGQVFGLLDSNINFKWGVQTERFWGNDGGSVKEHIHQYDSITIGINKSSLTIDRSAPPEFLKILRERNTGKYSTGRLNGSSLWLGAQDKLEMSDEELCQKIFEWATAYATYAPEKRATLLDTFSDKSLPELDASVETTDQSFNQVGRRFSRN